MTIETQDLAEAVVGGDRRALARAITLVESTRPDHRDAALVLLEHARAAGRQAVRLGLSGTPGVGKSTFIEAFGCRLVEDGKRVAVLAVDPSSARSGGSILGDKTRMERLSRATGAFIRPSPAARQLGGVARRTRDVVSLCEAAGFDVVLIETVGVGQSETMVAQMCDLFVLLLAPAGGDELQGVKRGIMEMADLILVNKADGDLRSAAMRTVADYAGALRLLRKRAQDAAGFPKAIAVSALQEEGLAEAWADMEALITWRRAQGWWDKTRAAQAEHWFQEDVRTGLLARLEDPEVQARLAVLGRSVAAGAQSPDAAARAFLEELAGPSQAP